MSFPTPLCFLLLCGLPASGKSILASILERAIPSVNSIMRCHIVRYDDLLAEWAVPREEDIELEGERYKEGRVRMMEVVEDLMKRILSEEIGMMHLVVIDDNMYYRSMRWPFYRMCRTYRQTFLQLHLCTPLSLCLSRNALRPPAVRVPDRIIHVMAGKFEPPSNEAWERDSSIAMNVDEAGNAERTVELVLRMWGEIGESQREEWRKEGEEKATRRQDRERTVASALHQLNLMLIEVVGRYVKGVDAERRGKVGKRLAAVKKKVLEEARIKVSTEEGMNIEEMVGEFERRITVAVD